MKLDEEIIIQTTKVKWGEYYAIWDLTWSNKVNLLVFDQMKRLGWDLVSINWGDAVFRKMKEDLT
jgi:hypothetical protein